MPPAVQKPSDKALHLFGKKQQNAAISSVLREGQESIITDTKKRLAKSKALDNKVWIGAAKTGSATVPSKKRPGPSSSQRYSKPKKTKVSQEQTNNDDDDAADHMAESTEKLPVVAKRSSAKTLVVVSGSDSEDDKNNGRRATKVTDSTAESNSDGQSDDEGRSQRRTSQAPKPSAASESKSQAQGAKKRLQRRQLEPQQEESDGDGGKENEARPVTKAITNRQNKRQKELPKWASTVDTDDEEQAPSKATKKNATALSKATKTAGIKPKDTLAAVATVNNMDTASVESDSTAANDAAMTSDGEFVQEKFRNKPGQWLPYTNLKYAPGKPISLLTQTTAVQDILRKAMLLANAELVFVKAFPTDGERNKFSRDATRAAAVLLDGERGHVVQRIDYDIGYLSMLSKIADARLSQFRLDLKKTATPIVLEHYGLKDGPGCAPLAKALLEKNAFLFPGDVMSAAGVDRTKPFGRGLFPVLLAKLFFQKSTDFGIAFQDRFFSSLEDDDELEMSAPMLSFAGVLAEHIIGECISGTHAMVPFSADISIERWKGNMSKLRYMFEKKLPRFHRFMVDLLDQARRLASSAEDDSNEIDWDNMSD